MWRVVFWLWVVAAIVLSVVPDDNAVMDAMKVSYNCVLEHAVYYAIGVWLCCRAWGDHITKKGRSIIFLCAGAVFALGFSLEIIQYFVPYRSCNIYDGVANLTGVTVGAMLIMIREKRK